MKHSVLKSAAMMLLITQKVIASQKAFVMLGEVEEEEPPYELVNLGNLGDYEVTPSYTLDLTQVTFAFTLMDIVYTNENVFCKRQDCCEARNFSYDPFFDYGEGYFPPCDMDALVDILSDQCNMTFSHQSVSIDTLGTNQSTVCDYYTLYSSSPLPPDLEACISRVFQERWPEFCANQIMSPSVPETALTMMLFSMSMLIVWRCVEAGLIKKGSRTKGSMCTNGWLSLLTMGSLSFSESTALFFTGVGFIYALPKLLNEYDLNLFTPVVFPKANTFFISIAAVFLAIRAIGHMCSVCCQSVKASFAVSHGEPKAQANSPR